MSQYSPFTNDTSSSIYGHSPLTNVYQQEVHQATDSFNKAREPHNGTGVIAGHGFQQKMLNENNMTDPRYHVNYEKKEGVVMVSELSGQPISRENFHDNQVPFIGGGVKQNTNPQVYETVLEHYTGTGPGIRPKKQEVKSFFDRKPDASGWVHGSPALTRYNLEDRFYASRYRQGEKPFQDIKVGPAINAGFGTEGHGGFHQANAQEITRAKANRVINNRLPNNPRITYSRPLKPGALKSGSRGLQAAVRKNRPERWYRNSPDRYFVTGGVVKASKLREKVNAKATKRQNHRPYFGGIKNAQMLKHKKDPAVKKSTRNNFMNDYFRNLYRENAWKSSDASDKAGVGDYGKTSIENRPNERDVTHIRNHRLNVTTNVKKLITPLTDLFRKTRKENFIGNIRPEGNMKAQMPSKLTIHDPEDIARTTRKEQNIHNNHEGFLKGPVSNQVWDPEDVARTTRKELNIDNKAPFINMKPQQPNNLRVYDPEDIARTTLKEMTEENNHIGFTQYPEHLHPGGYVSTNVKMRNTHKQFISDYFYVGAPDGKVGKGDGHGYLTNRYKARNTHKQFLSDYEYTGNAGHYQPQQKSYSNAYNARLNPNREIISQGRHPTPSKEKLNKGKDFVNISHKKIESDRINIREPAENRVYQTPPQKNNCGMTNTKQTLPEHTQRQRLDPDLLNAFKQNPYTQSLKSAV